MAVAAAKKPATYHVATTTNRRQYETRESGLTKREAERLVDRLFGNEASIRQAVIYNEATARVVARYEEEYDSTKHCFVIKRTGTR